MVLRLNQDKLRSAAFALAAVVGTLGATRSAQAHIDVNMAGTHTSRSSDSFFGIKTAPCGQAGSTRGTEVFTYRPGDTINVSVTETIPHPGYFRISFDDDGDDDFVIPEGTEGEFGDAACENHPLCGPGNGDYCSNETVLLDHLNPHPAGGQKTYTWSVTLPDVECDNCTLQIIQMMNDFGPHAPQDYPDADIYYHCIELVLSEDAPPSGDTPVDNEGIDCKAGDPAPVAETGEPVVDTEAQAPDGTGMMPATEPSEPAPSGTESAAMAPEVTPAEDGTGGIPSAPAAGAAAPSSTGTAGTAASGTTTGTTAATTGAAGMLDGQPVTEASVPTATTSASASNDDGGCQVASGSSTAAMGAPLLIGLAWLRRRRRLSLKRDSQRS